jgi:hypothetical protein
MSSQFIKRNNLKANKSRQQTTQFVNHHVIGSNNSHDFPSGSRYPLANSQPITKLTHQPEAAWIRYSCDKKEMIQSQRSEPTLPGRRGKEELPESTQR